jgi:hypothetical protein
MTCFQDKSQNGQSEKKSTTITHSKFNGTISTSEKLKLLLPYSCQLSQITKHLQQSEFVKADRLSVFCQDPV